MDLSKTRHLYLSGVCLGVHLKTWTKKKCVEEKLDHVFKVANYYTTTIMGLWIHVALTQCNIVLNVESTYLDLMTS